MSEQNDRPTLAHISWIVWGLLIVLVLFLASAFSQAWSVHQALEEKEVLLGPMLTEQQNKNATLQAQLTYVQSEPYVEEWAGESARMAQENETLVVFIVSTPTPTATFVPTPTLTPTPLPFYQEWWQAVFGR